MKTQYVNRLFAAVIPLIAVLVLFTSVVYAAPNRALLPDASTDASALEIAFFNAKPTGGGVVLTWRTGPEAGLTGFNIYRAQGADDWQKINKELVVATGGLGDRNDYAWTDATAKNGQSYFYRLEYLQSGGAASSHTPIRVKAGAPLRLGLDEVNGQMLATLWPAVLGALVAVGGFSLMNRKRK